MKTTLKLLALALLIPMTASMAQAGDTNISSITQIGPGEEGSSVLAIEQAGEGNFGRIVAEGDANQARIVQGNRMDESARAFQSTAAIKQYGNENTGYADQYGMGNRAELVQVGSGNEGLITQLGMGNIGTLEQTGQGNVASIHQDGGLQTAMIVQQGMGNTAAIAQH